MKPQSSLKEALIGTRGAARARLQLVRKFREQLNFKNAECAGGRIVRRAQRDHRPHEPPIGIAEIRGVATQHCRQHVLERCQTRCDRFPLSTRSRPWPASTDSSGLRHFPPFELFGDQAVPYPQRDKSNCRIVAKSDSRWRALTPRPCDPVPWSRRGALQFDLSQRETITNGSRPGQDCLAKA